MLRINEIKVNIDEKIDVLPSRVLKKLGVKDLEIKEMRVVKESIDARDKGDIKLVYTVDFIPQMGEEKTEELEEQLILKCKGSKLEKAPDMNYQPPNSGSEEMKTRPVIVGFGPCGMFAGLILSELGYKPVILERGKSIEDRIKDVESFWNDGILDEESNVQFGEGGAGLFSDGKLTTQIKDPRVRKVLEEFVKAGAPEELLYKQKPHIGTDVLRKVVINIRKTILERGGEILFQSKLTDLVLLEANETQIKGVRVNHNTEIKTDALILAIGHSARDTFRSLNGQGVEMAQKPFSIGVRIEHYQDMINEAQLGKNWRNYDLGAADYKLAHHCQNGRGVYTFCMCPGGYVIGAASQKGGVVTNGMSYNDRGSKVANSALLVDVRTEDFADASPLSGIDFQEKYERLAFEAGGGNYKAPAQRLKDFMYGKPVKSNNRVPVTYKPGVTWTDLSKCLPEFAVESMKEAIPKLGNKLRGFAADDAVMTGVETRSSSPVRIIRDANLMNIVKGLYPAGEGAGYAGGIMSAAVDGIKVAEEIIKKYKNLK